MTSVRRFLDSRWNGGVTNQEQEKIDRLREQRLRLDEDRIKQEQEQDAQSQRQNGCVNSSQCASGFSCIGGKCVKVNYTSGRNQGGVSGPGSSGGCAPTAPGSGDVKFPVFPCGGVPLGSTPTCGNDNCFTTPSSGNSPGGYPGTDCGPQDCCRFDEASGSVRCLPGQCTPTPRPPGGPDQPDPTNPPPPPGGEDPVGPGDDGPLVPEPEPPIQPIPCDRCPPGLECRNNACAPIPCNTDPECPDSFTCGGGACLPEPEPPEGEPEPPGGCGPGTCDGEECVCPDGFKCSEGNCVPDPFEPPPAPDPDYPDGDGPPEVPDPEDPEDPGVPEVPELPEPPAGPGPSDPDDPNSPPNPGAPDGSDGGDGGYGPIGGLPPSGGSCNGYCDSYYQLFGEEYPSCAPNDRCDECSECTSGTCYEKIGNTGPCWCNPDKCNYNGNECQVCDVNPDSGSYGECTFGPDCSKCATVFGPCCPEETITATACASMKEYGDFASTQAMINAYKKLDMLCDADKKQNCPPDPDEPEPCDCNCNNDCPPCFICNAAGKCVPDPDCESPCDEDEERGTVYTQTVELVNGSTIDYTTFGPLQWEPAVSETGAPVCYAGGSTFRLCSDCNTCPRAGRILNVRLTSLPNTYCSRTALTEGLIVSITNQEPGADICCEPRPE